MLTSYGNDTISYDSIGNPLSYRGATLSWDCRQLISYDNISYKYNSDGLRTEKTTATGTTTYEYVNGKLAYENREGNKLYYYYDSYGTPTGVYIDPVSGSTKYLYFATNSMGDIIGVYDGAGTHYIEYKYDAWGNIVSETTPTGAALTGDSLMWSELIPFRYRGYYYDKDTGLYYLQSRYYDPEVGRFINADNQLNQDIRITGYNLFSYGGNNPINTIDPTGHAFMLLTAAIGAVAGAVVGGCIAVSRGKSVWSGISVGAVACGVIGLGVGAIAGTLLAGSATASVASVATGARALASVVGSAGVTAGAKMLIDNVTQACNSASQVFWSGGEIAKNASKQVANNIGGKTLEMTRLGTYLEQINAPYSTWQAASSNFANVASNSNSTIYSIQNAAGISLRSTWATIEYPLLQSKEIIYGVVSQDGTIHIMP